MNEEVRGMFPKWCQDKNKDSSLMIGDDIDSLMTAMVLQHINGNEIDWFYDFEREYIVEGSFLDEFDRIGCDMALTSGRTWDNHVTMMYKDDVYNVDSANLNNFYRINRTNYTDKYAGSTLLLVYSYFNIPLPESKEGKMILLAIDSSFKGHYSSRFKKTNNEWLRLLGFEELVQLMEEVTIDDFYDVIRKYKLNEKIGLSGGRLVTKVDLEGIGKHFSFNVQLPNKVFEVYETYKRGNIDLRKYDKAKKKPVKSHRIVSFAMTYQNNASYTIRPK